MWGPLSGSASQVITAAAGYDPDPRRVTGLLFAYNLDETDDGTRYSFDSKGPDLSTVVNAPDNPVGGGIINEAMQQDGTQYVQSTDASIEGLLEGLSTFSIQFWYKRTDASVNFNTMFNWGYSEPMCLFYGPAFYHDHNLYIDDTSVYRVYEYASHSPRVLTWLDGNWHHVIWTFDGGEASADRVKFYFDGVDVATTSIAGAITTAPSMTSLTQSRSEMDIAAQVNGGQPMSGSMDLVGFWNWTMTPEDVAYEYNGGSAQAFVAE